MFLENVHNAAQEICFDFSHGNAEFIDDAGNLPLTVGDRRYTDCTVTVRDKQTGNVVFTNSATAICNPFDNYCYKEGRKVSLLKALSDVGPLLKGDIIQTWFSRPGKDKQPVNNF